MRNICQNQAMQQWGGTSRKVFPLEKLDEYIDKDNDYLLVAILWNRLNADRRHMYERVKSMGYKLANIFFATC